MKSFFGLCLLLGLALSQVSGSCPESCPDTEEVVWALDGGRCSVFRNKCYFDQTNCTKETGEQLTVTTKEECQPKCASICTAIFQPVSGTYRGKTRQFGNACSKQAHACTTGETYL
ncbi:uncharacterized protein LOC110188016 [Drosophila serrata]|uniref:uncharacterized protein LOC110188016 n=1 Tax=Drosophila serrata TaxID=7274 RepID=UPI000A1D289E|nr:uncharacterized protein LOC110188016 [Drosophila serrata]